MAASVLSSTKSNREIPALVWLEPDGHKTFNQVTECENYIQSTTKGKRLIVMVHQSVAKEIVSRIETLAQVVSIYLFGMEGETKDEWISHYTKIKGTVMILDDLIDCIREDLGHEIDNRNVEDLVFNIYNTDPSQEQSTTGLNGQFIYVQLLIHCLLHMKEMSNTSDELIAYCQQQYKDNKDTLKILEEFQTNYIPDRSLWWYTRESFLYRQLNRALRVFDIDLLFMFRFFIRDLRKQLNQHQCSSPVQVFRGQLLLKNELEALKKSIGQLISMNSFLSTSIDRQLAISFLYSGTSSDERQRILLEIDADPSLVDHKPFANITKFSYFPNEDEILFMLGSVFRLNSIEQDEKGIWILRLSLCSESDPNLKAIFDDLKNQCGSFETNLHSFDFALAQMGKFDEAEKYFHRVIKGIPAELEDVAGCYHNVADILNQKGDFETSLKWDEKALEMMLRSVSTDNPKIGIIYNSIAVVHTRMGRYEQAVEFYNKAYQIWREAFGEEHIYIALLLSNLGGIHQEHEKPLEALDCLQKALKIRQNQLPDNHPQLADNHHNLGSVYISLNQLDLALEQFQISLKMKEKSLPRNHPNFGTTLSNMGLVYEKKEQWQKALNCFEQAIAIQRQTFHSDHPNIVHMNRLIQRVSLKLK